jgi:hypothetical protein
MRKTQPETGMSQQVTINECISSGTATLTCYCIAWAAGGIIIIIIILRLVERSERADVFYCVLLP